LGDRGGFDVDLRGLEDLPTVLPATARENYDEQIRLAGCVWPLKGVAISTTRTCQNMARGGILRP
jgi:hypothetical protein